MSIFELIFLSAAIGLFLGIPIGILIEMMDVREIKEMENK